MTRQFVLPFLAVLCACGDVSGPNGGAPASMTIVSGDVGATAAGFETADSIAIKVTDNKNQPMPEQSVTFSIVAGGGTVNVASKKTGSDGIARTSWTIGKSGAQTLRASAGSLQVDVNAIAANCPELAMPVGDVRSLDPSDAACAILSGSAQRYLVTVVNPTNSPLMTTGFRVRGSSGATSAQAEASRVRMPAVAIGYDDRMSESVARDRAHMRILENNMEQLRRLGRPASGAQSSSVVAAQRVAPAVGDLIPMKLPDITINGCTSFTNVTARVVYVGAKSIMLEDTGNPLSGKVDTLYARVGQVFDNVMFPILSKNFGNPLVMDAQLNNDGAMYMLFSSKVNTMGTGQIAGFVSSFDFYPTSQCPSSNVAETFYARAPTTLGVVAGEPTPFWEFTRAIEGTIIHEAKHLTSFANKAAQPGFTGAKPPQDAWLEEGSAEIAQELLSRVTFSYAARNNVNYAATIFKEVRPSTGTPFNMFNAFRWLNGWVSDPEATSMVGSTGPGDVNFYGSGWGFLRWVIDTYATSESAFLTAMTRDIAHFGVENIENLTGKPFSQLLSEYSLVLALDDYPGLTPLDAKYSFPSWNLRSIFAGMNADFPTTYPTPAPLKTRVMTFGRFNVEVSGVRGGGFSVLELSGAPSSRQLLEFKSVNGTALAPWMRVNIVRVQ